LSPLNLQLAIVAESDKNQTKMKTTNKMKNTDFKKGANVYTIVKGQPLENVILNYSGNNLVVAPTKGRHRSKNITLAETYLFASFNYFEVLLSAKVCGLCSHWGDCDEDVARCLELPEVNAEIYKIDSEELIKELSDYGAWDVAQLSIDQDNRRRILWIAASNILEDNTVFHYKN